MKRYVAEIAALTHNVALLLKKAKETVVWGVIKGNGYGLGIVPMAQLLAEHGISHFAVTELAEVEALRQAGLSHPVLMMESTCNPSELQRLLELHAIITVGSAEAATALNEAAQAAGLVAQAHVKIDTGMGRFGFLPEEEDRIKSLYEEYPFITCTGIYTHFYDSADPIPTRAQFAAFLSVVDGLRKAGIDPGMVHCCNSSAFLMYPEMHCDAVRVGSALLGRVTVGADTGLKPVGYCEAEIEVLRDIPVGHTVGYGAGWRAKRQTKIAVIGIGYSNGFGVDRGFDLWRLKDCIRGVARYIKAFIRHKALYVSINGCPCRVLGHVGMVNLVVDVTDCPCRTGDLARIDINPLLLKGVPVEFL